MALPHLLHQHHCHGEQERSGRVLRLERAAPWPLKGRVLRLGRAVRSQARELLRRVARRPDRGRGQELRPHSRTWGKNWSWHRKDIRRRNQSGVCRDPPVWDRDWSGDWSRERSWHREDLRRGNQSGVCRDPPALDRDWSRRRCEDH
ncbi:unnamed protein product [Pleuronectes platessa]|uniref:Uncharacterized protein n=1 Tax=Pleuronectes platessa TaxID=8262 RepID=A0A9N7UUC8_PLEPL|nr:unnamed protein product [Pleuronectes platessa]